MKDSDYLQATLQVTQLTTGTEYRKAMLLSRRRGSDSLARADRNSEEYASIRLLIGTWEAIAAICAKFNARQRTAFFRSNPVALVWQYLEPATTIIRGHTDSNFAENFEALNNQYQQWSRGKEGARYTTAQQQALNARFLV